MFLQHFYLCLSEKSTHFLNITSGRAFLHLSDSEGRVILDRILENYPYTDIHDDSLAKMDNATPMQEEVPLPKLLPIASIPLAIIPMFEPFLGTQKEEEIHPLEFSL